LANTHKGSLDIRDRAHRCQLTDDPPRGITPARGT
jgi:hypothetical protein